MVGTQTKLSFARLSVEQAIQVPSLLYEEQSSMVETQRDRSTVNE
jgi:hypothetical protein